MSHHASNNHILRRRLRSLLSPTTALTLCAPGIALAGPTGEDVIRGHADITRPDANNTIIKQYTDKAVINWQTFNVDADEYVIFNQLDASSIVLNRVLGGDTSYILGHIQANGQVFLLNPNGVFFTHGASLDVQGFLASTLDMNPDSFMNGDFTLTRSADAPATASIINDGNITAGPGGYVVLAGDYTENTGIITANAGTVALVSGNALTLDIQGDGLVSFTVDEATLSEAAGVRNAGSLIADGGRVIMTAKVASDLVATAVNNEGLVRAHSVEQRNGEIYLVGNGGNVSNSGTLDADGENANGGGIALYSDRDVTLADGGVQTAAGDGNHEGGVIRAIAEGHLDYQKDNLIRVTGGINGGFVEVSGHGSLALRGTPDIGPGGELLIDPSILAIRNGGDATPFGSSAFAISPTCIDAVCSGSATILTTGWIAGRLNSSVDVTLVASNTILLDETLIPVGLTASGNADLRIAIGTITTSNGATGFGAPPGSGSEGGWIGGPPSITLANDGDIKLGGLNITLTHASADLFVTGQNGQVAMGELDVGGNVTVTGGDVSVAVIANANTANITGTSTGTMGRGNVSIGTGFATPSSSSYPDILNITADRDVTLSGIGLSSALVVTAGGTINIGTTAVDGISDGSLGGFTADITLTAPTIVSNAVMYVAGNITINGDVTGAQFQAGSSFSSTGSVGGWGAGDVVINGNINVSGPIKVFGNQPDGGLHVTGSVNASSIEVEANSSGRIQFDSQVHTLGNVLLSGNITGSNLLIGSSAQAVQSLTINGAANVNGDIDVWMRSIAPGAGITINGNLIATGDVRLQAAGSSGASPFIDITGDVVASSGVIHINASNASGAANATFNGDITAANGVSFLLAGSGTGDIITVNGNVTATTGNISFGTNVDTVSFGTSQHVLDAGGDILMQNNPSLAINGNAAQVDYIAGGNIRIRAASSLVADTLDAGGLIDLQAGNGITINGATADGSHVRFSANTISINGDVTATNGDLLFDAVVSTVSFGAASHTLTAGGNIALNGLDLAGNSASVDYVAGGTMSFSIPGGFNARNIDAGIVFISADGSGAVVDVKNVTATDQINISADIAAGGTVSITTGTLAVTGVGGSSVGLINIQTSPSTSASSNTITANLDFAGITAAQNVFIANGAANGIQQLGNFSGIDNLLTINTQNGGDIGSLSFGGAFTLNANGVAVDFVGDINVGGDVQVSAANINDVFPSTGITAGGNLSLTASDGDVTVHDVTATGNISITANGNAASGGNISIGQGQAGLGITMLASGSGSATDGGNVTIASGLLAGGNVTIDAVAPSGGNHGGNIKVNGGGIQTTAGFVDLFGTGGNISGGNISIIGAGTVGVVATNGITIDASANGGAPTSGALNGNINIAGQVRGGSGAVVLRAGTATQGGSGANVIITGIGGSAGVVEGTNVSITASAAFGSGTGLRSGQVHLGTGAPESSFDGAAVNATGFVAINVDGGKGVITAGNVSAANSVSLLADGVQGHVHLGDYTGGLLTAPGSITAGNMLTINVTGSVARIDFGNASAGNQINLGAHATTGGTATIKVGTLATTGTSFGGDINIGLGAASSASAATVTGTLALGGITDANSVFVNINTGNGSFELDNMSNIAGGVSVITSVSGDVGVAGMSGNFDFQGDSDTSVNFSGNVTAGGYVLVNANTASATPGVTLSAGDAITFSNEVTAMSSAALVAVNNVNINASGPQANIDIGAVDGASIGIHANASSAGFGNVTLGNVTGTGMVVIDADNNGSGGGTVTVDNVTGSNVQLNAYTNSGTGGTITVNGNAIATTSGMMLFASNFTGAATIKLLGDASAAGSFFANVDGAGVADTIEIHGNVTAGNNLDFGSGITNLTFATGSHAVSAANIFISNPQNVLNGASVNYTATGDISISTTTIETGDLTAGGMVQVQGNGGATHTIGNVSAQHIDMHFNPMSGGTVNVTTGDLSASGTTSFNRDVVVQIHGGSGSTAGNLTVGDVTTANGEIQLSVFDGASGTGLGNITAGALSAERFVRVNGRGNVTTGGITVNNANGMAFADIRSVNSSASMGGNIIVNGGINVSGVASGNNPQAAGVFLDAGQANHDITVTGAITANAAAGAFSFSGTDSGHAVTGSGSLGVGNVHVGTRFGTVSLGDVNVTAVGEGNVEVLGLHVTMGDIALNVANGTSTRTTTLTSCEITCNLVQTETLSSGGRGEVHLGYYGVAIDGTLDFGNVTVDAGDARFDAYGFADINGGAITLNAAGENLLMSSTGTFNGETINYTETGNGGGAQLTMATVPGGAVTLTDTVNVSAQGRALVEIAADSISVQDINATATGGTFVRTGQPAPLDSDDGPFSGGIESASPQIDAGTITGGIAAIHLGGAFSSSSTSGQPFASTVNVNGTLTTTAPGSAQIGIAGNSITVSGGLAASADALVQNGTRFESSVDSAGDTIETASVVASSYGEAEISVSGSSAGVINIGAITATGPAFNGHVEGGDLNIGAITLTGTGGDLDVTETTTNLTTSAVTNFEFHGPGLVAGFGIEGAGAVNVSGDISITAVGGGGTIIRGDSINLQNVAINVTNGAYDLLDTEVFGADPHAFTLGDAILDIDAASTATVDGDVNVTAASTAHLGGEYTITGSANLETGKGVTGAISDELQYLLSVGEDGDGGPLVLSAPWNVSATNITVSATAGGLNLAGQSLDATDNLALDATGNVRLAGTSLTAETLVISTAGNITHGALASSIAAGALAITAGGNIDLSNTEITAGTGGFAGITGDTALLPLLTAEELTAPAGGPNVYVQGQDVVLGDLQLAGDYLFIKADSLALNGAVTSSNADLLVQLAPINAGATMSLTQSGANDDMSNYSNTGHLSFFAGNTIALGTTGHNGDISIAADGATIDIGSTNLFVLTNGTVTGLDNVLSTGIVKDLYTLIHGEFEVPQTDEIDTSQDIVKVLNDDYELDDGEDEEEGDEEGEDTDTDTGTDGDGDELISRDTVDEELMCQ